MTNWFPSVLWHCWFGHLACKNRPSNDLLCVEWDVKQPSTLLLPIHASYYRLKSLYCIHSGGRGGVFRLYLPQTWTDLDETRNISEGSQFALAQKNSGEIAKNWRVWYIEHFSVSTHNMGVTNYQKQSGFFWPTLYITIMYSLHWNCLLTVCLLCFTDSLLT